MTEAELSLLTRAQKLLDKGCVRYSDRNFEEEREKLASDIETYLKPPELLQAQVMTPEEVAETVGETPKRVHLPVVK